MYSKIAKKIKIIRSVHNENVGENKKVRNKKSVDEKFVVNTVRTVHDASTEFIKPKLHACKFGLIN
jgi:hypothetical protein